MGNETYSPEAPAQRQGGWAAPLAAGPLNSSLRVPGSKSLTNRELVLAALADGTSRLIGPLHSEDSARMVDAIQALGVTVEYVTGDGQFGDDLVVTSDGTLRGGGVVDSGQAGTVMRFVAPMLGLATDTVTLTADETALHRPMAEMIRALRDVGVDVDDGGRWSLPFMVHGKGHVRGGAVEVDAASSSQFISGLLLSAARFDVGVQMIHTGETLPSLPHIDMTVACLARRGVHVEQPGPNEWVVPAGSIRARDVKIEPDLSNAAPFLAAALATRGRVSVAGWPAHSTQPGAMITDLLALMGARASRRVSVMSVTSTRPITGIDVDLSAASELTPTLVALAALADSPSTFRGIGHIRGHETDRIAALVGNLRALGGHAEEWEDGIRVVPQPLHGGTWQAHHDHRIATAGAIIGLVVPGVEVDDISTTAKTIPQFVDLWQTMLTTIRGGASA